MLRVVRWCVCCVSCVVCRVSCAVCCVLCAVCCLLCVVCCVSFSFLFWLSFSLASCLVVVLVLFLDLDAFIIIVLWWPLFAFRGIVIGLVVVIVIFISSYRYLHYYYRDRYVLPRFAAHSAANPISTKTQGYFLEATPPLKHPLGPPLDNAARVLASARATRETRTGIDVTNVKRGCSRRMYV